MDTPGTWKSTWRWVAGAAAVAYVALGAYTGDGWVFPFSYADLGFHELGHLLTMFWAPPPLTAFAGSFAQVAVPLGLGAYFALVRRDRVSASIMLAWAGASTNNVSVYIHDATRQVLPLLGGQDGHDWAYLLGPGVLDALDATDGIAFGVRVASALLLSAAFGLLAWGYAEPRRAARAAAALEEYRATLPVRAPRNPVLLPDATEREPTAPAGSRALD
ncbi:MAG: hypothetical protein WBI91_01800 [Coriobacteriia bacterium]|jgi:hypothetical protein